MLGINILAVLFGSLLFANVTLGMIICGQDKITSSVAWELRIFTHVDQMCGRGEESNSLGFLCSHRAGEESRPKGFLESFPREMPRHQPWCSKLEELPHVRGRPTPESTNTTRGSRHSAGSAVGVTE